MPNVNLFDVARQSSINKFYINITDYGCSTANADNLTEFLAAVTAAKTNKAYIYIPDGVFTIIYPNTEAIDMNGCLGFFGSGTLEFDTVSSDKDVMNWKGDVDLIGSAVSVNKDDNTATIDTGLSLSVGDTIFLISIENVGNTNNDYMRGQRLTIQEYNDVNGDVIFYERFYQSITSGYFYHNNIMPKISISGVNIFAKENTYRKAVSLTFCDVSIKDVYIKSFSKYCLNISSSKANVVNYRAADFFFNPSTTSYGLQVSGLTNIESWNLDLKGGRHALTHGDDGTWIKGDAGDVSPTQGDPIFLLSESTTWGGTYSPHKDSEGYTIDVHACHYLIMNGGVVEGGMNLSGEYHEFNSIHLKSSIPDSIVLAGRSLDPDIARGRFIFRDLKTSSIAVSSIFRLSGSVRELTVNGLKLSIDYSVVSIVNLFNYANDNTIADKFNFTSVDVVSNLTNKSFLNLRINKESVLDSITLESCELSIETYGATGDALEVKNILSKNSNRHGVLQNVGVGQDRVNLIVTNVRTVNSVNEGVYIIGSKDISISNLKSYDSGDRGVRIRYLDSQIKLVDVKISGSGSQGLLLQELAGDTFSEIDIVACDLRGNTGTNYDAPVSLNVAQSVAVLS